MNKSAQAVMFTSFRKELEKIASRELLLAFLKEAGILPGATAQGVAHAEGLLAGLGRKMVPRTGKIVGEHNSIVGMARAAGHVGERGSAIQSLLPGVSKPLSAAPLPGFSMPPMSSMRPTMPPMATMAPGATIPARAA